MSQLILVFMLICIFGQIHSAKIRDCNSKHILPGTTVELTCATDDNDYCVVKQGMNAKIRVTFTPTSNVGKLYAHAFGKVLFLTHDLNIPTNACSGSGLDCPLKANQSHTWILEMPVQSLPSLITSGEIVLALGTSETRGTVEEDANDLVCSVASVKID